MYKYRDGVEHPVTAFNGLFKRIYDQAAVPSQWPNLNQKESQICHVTLNYI